MYQKTVLLVLEGFGVNNKKFGNTIINSNMKKYRSLIEQYPNTLLKTDLNKGDENTLSSPIYGFLNIARCKKTVTYISKLNDMIENGDFFSNTALQNTFTKVSKNGGNLHLIGMISDGELETGIRQIKAFLEAAKRKDLKVFIHLISDGMDSNQRKILEYLEELEEVLKIKNIGVIASIQGRDYALNKTGKWDKTKQAYQAIYYGVGKKVNNKYDIYSQIEEQYMQDKFDNEITPIVVYHGNEYIGKINKGDGVIFFNTIQNRLLQLEEAFSNPYFEHFETDSNNIEILTTTKSKVLDKDSLYIIPEEQSINLLKEMEKNNIGINIVYDKVREYEIENILTLQEDINMKKNLVNEFEYTEYVSNITKSISNITKETIKQIYLEKEESLNGELIIVDYPQLDILAHSGRVFELELALKKIDEDIFKIYEEAIKNNCRIIITSTHGNAEEMFEEKTGEILTRNTKNMIPLIYINPLENRKLKYGSIYNIGSTILEILNISKENNKRESLLI
ncbi:MAG: hypothetical protein ACTTGJ_03165 [Clostridium sp.]